MTGIDGDTWYRDGRYLVMEETAPGDTAVTVWTADDEHNEGPAIQLTAQMCRAVADSLYARATLITTTAPEPPRIDRVEAVVPVVYAWCASTQNDGAQNWVAVCDDGELMAHHTSTSRASGETDVHLTYAATAERYGTKFGGLDDEHYRFVVVPEGMLPPAEVMEANRHWAERPTTAQGEQP